MEDIIELFSGFLPFLFIAIGIIATAMQRTKKARARQGSKNPNSESNMDKAFGEQTEQKKPVGFIENLKKVIAEELEKDSEKELGNSSKKSVQTSQKDFRAEVEATKLAKGETQHTHVAMTPTVAGKSVTVRTEKVYSSGSLEGKSTEGCLEHKDTRFIIDDIPVASESNANIEDLQKYIVWAEILDKPKFKM